MTELEPQQTVTFTVTGIPARKAQVITIKRLMKMQPEMQNGLRRRAKRRRLVDNVPTIRAGRTWIRRARVPKLVRVEPGESFTLTLTPQIIPDVRSVEKFLQAKKA